MKKEEEKVAKQKGKKKKGIIIRGVNHAKYAALTMKYIRKMTKGRKGIKKGSFTLMTIKEKSEMQKRKPTERFRKDQGHRQKGRRYVEKKDKWKREWGHRLD